MTTKYIPTNRRAELWEHFETLLRATEASYRSVGALIQNPMDFNEADLERGREQFEAIRAKQDEEFAKFGESIFDSFVEGSVFTEMDEDEKLERGGKPTRDDG